MGEPIRVRLHPHAVARCAERGATHAEVVGTVLEGERYAAKHARMGFRRNFPYDSMWRGSLYATKQVEAIAVAEGSEWIVITVIVRFF